MNKFIITYQLPYGELVRRSCYAETGFEALYTAYETIDTRIPPDAVVVDIRLDIP